MPKTIKSLKHQLTALRDMYVIPAEAYEARTEIRRIVKSFESHVADLRYEELDSAAALNSK